MAPGVRAAGVVVVSAGAVTHNAHYPRAVQHHQGHEERGIRAFGGGVGTAEMQSMPNCMHGTHLGPWLCESAKGNLNHTAERAWDGGWQIGPDSSNWLAAARAARSAMPPRCPCKADDTQGCNDTQPGRMRSLHDTTAPAGGVSCTGPRPWALASPPFSQLSPLSP